MLCWFSLSLNAIHKYLVDTIYKVPKSCTMCCRYKSPKDKDIARQKKDDYAIWPSNCFPLCMTGHVPGSKRGGRLVFSCFSVLFLFLHCFHCFICFDWLSVNVSKFFEAISLPNNRTSLQQLVNCSQCVKGLYWMSNIIPAKCTIRIIFKAHFGSQADNVYHLDPESRVHNGNKRRLELKWLMVWRCPTDNFQFIWPTEVC